MDMKKILQAFDSAASKQPVADATDMKKFLSIVKGIPSIGQVQTESVISSFDEDTIGGDANSFLIAADEINDLVMSQIEKIKINANEEMLKDMMDKFNEFMSAYHRVGKDILQPDMFNDSLEEETQDMGDGVRKKTNPDGSYEISDGGGTKHYNAQGKLTKTVSPSFAGVQNTTNADGSSSSSYQQGPLSVKQDKDASGKVTATDSEYQIGANKVRQQKIGQQAANTVKESFLDYLALAEAKQKGVDGKACWDGYKRMGTKQKGGKTVDNCVPTGKK
jgi:hypothetical protein